MTTARHPRVLIVGAGISGAACANSLREQGIDVTVRDRGRAPGGRMASPSLHGRPIDLGAAYFTVAHADFRVIVDDWAGRGMAREWTDTLDVFDGADRGSKQGAVRWAARDGLRSLVRDLQQEVALGVGLSEIPSGYDAVVLAMPDPQALSVLAPEMEQERSLLEGRAWEPVLVLAARWPERSWDWDGLFVDDSDTLAWLADDGSRRGDGAPVLTAHSTPAFASTRLAVPAAAAPELVAALATLGLPPPSEVLRVQRWTFAKPVGTRDALFALTDQGVGLCGDGWGAARVETAWRSGTALGQALSS